ncbi:MerR family transcriptional regulator [Enterococcus mundtii]|uniref:MerR family transcriptional regulator n=1 Tax=Enterococcus mundtii TaxID=53346 RepID=UPI000D39A655|nr:MerR family transcriptional regulator [Enterococcus mundtii]PTO38272.1 MerR family transcriptional regulator [Enterococcus mundtii]PTO44050.1 MerR family transcriptional regulator [Enterococcus mundtii]
MKTLYSIGEVAELLDIPRSTIRYWDAEGLIHAAREEENGYRLFDIDAIFQVYDINFYRKLDIPMKQMKNLYSKSLNEMYDILAETEQRLDHEKKILEQKHKEVLSRKNQLKEMIDSPPNEFPEEEIPFQKIVMAASDDILYSKEYLKNYSSFVIYFPENTQNGIYGFCTDEHTKELPGSQTIWQNDPTKKYVRFLLKVQVDHTKNNNLLEVKEKLYEQGYHSGRAIGQYLLTHTTKENISFEYYRAWIEVSEGE